jgi:dolichol kinase
LSEGSHPRKGLNELVGRTEGLQPWRRVFHVGGGCVAAWIAHALSPQAASTRWVFGAVLATAVLMDLVRLRSEALNRLFFRAFAALASPREREKMSVTWPLLGMLLVLLFAPGTVVVPAILVFAVSDPSASVIGRLWGKHRVGKGTLEGSAAFFITAVAVLIPFVGVSVALPVAAVVAALEVFSMGLDDNFVIPIATALGLWAFTAMA